ncbi:unnamed protein product [Staurois parvus]|uniref:Uncharacterized protein n=1 Tax=Staurois parvus TaxID=386267 RepID=A0ABN9ELZ3_9NEOB|nr:unnamed protein product [Staurois parvus]
MKRLNHQKANKRNNLRSTMMKHPLTMTESERMFSKALAIS